MKKIEGYNVTAKIIPSLTGRQKILHRTYFSLYVFYEKCMRDIAISKMLYSTPKWYKKGD